MEIINNSDNKSYTRYSYGSVTLLHKGREVTTSVGSKYDDFLTQMNGISSREGRIPIFCANRPDEISNIFYGSPGHWWFPMQYNSYFDPFEDLNQGDRIFIPDLE